MEKIKYLLTLTFGTQWQLLVIGMIMMLIMAYKNCIPSKSTGQVFYRRDNSFFVFLSTVAGVFHAADLLGEWIKGNLELIEETAVENPGTAIIGSVAIAVLLGIAMGVIFYSVSQMVMIRRSNFIERRYMLTHIRRLCRQYNKYYY